MTESRSRIDVEARRREDRETPGLGRAQTCTRAPPSVLDDPQGIVRRIRDRRQAEPRDQVVDVARGPPAVARGSSRSRRRTPEIAWLRRPVVTSRPAGGADPPADRRGRDELVNCVAQRDAAGERAGVALLDRGGDDGIFPSAARARASRQSTIERAMPRRRTSGWTTSEWSRANARPPTAQDDLLEFDQAEPDHPAGPDDPSRSTTTPA